MYCVIITAPAGEKQVVTRRWDGSTIDSATAAVCVLLGFQELFPGYSYDWAPVRSC